MSKIDELNAELEQYVAQAESIKSKVKTIAENKEISIIGGKDTPDTVLDKINSGTIKTPTETVEINSNGSVDVTNYSNANVNVQPNLQTKQITITSNGIETITPDSGYDGLSSVEVTTDAGGYSVNSIKLSDGTQELQIKGVDKFSLQSKTATPTTQNQTITFDSGYDGLSEVQVDAVTSAIDSNITPTNIRAGVSILGVAGNLEPDKPDQSKTVAPTTSSQTITADTGYELASVTINAVDNTIDANIQPENIKKDVTILGVTGTLEEGITPTGTINITENGTYDVTNYANANVNVQSGGIPEPTPTSASLFNITGNTITNYIGSEKDVVVPLSYSISTGSGYSEGISLNPYDYNGLFGYFSDPPRLMAFEKDSITKTYTEFGDNFYSQLEQDFPNGCFLIHVEGSPYSFSFITSISHVDINVNGKLFTGSYSGRDAFDYITKEYITNVNFEGNYSKEIIVDGTDISITAMKRAQSYYNDISNLTILDNITNIEKQTFASTNLDTITVDPKNPKYISKGNCLIDKDTNVLIAGSNNSIIPDGVTSIESQAFSGCKKITTVTIPDSVTDIGINAFFYCSKLTTVTIGNNVTTINAQAFSWCTDLKTITIGNNVTSIGSQAFSNCYDLTSITIPDSVTGIGDYAFYDCTGLTSVMIGSGVTSIGSSAFGYCNKLTSITIPESVISIGSQAFSQCSKLTTMTIKATTPPTLSSTSAISTATTKIYIPAGTLLAYRSATNWSSFASKFVELS